ncbi:MIP/aquaporin family protein [uncultured Ilyobacter sp.]|uniref:MIP/aquaporin family protein n=1 Tax=uncultured Ilyobacter sp. TaxID=544433 RepID=UPI0029C7A17A|nr:MIP/aquaporin family protein [uncultured Ilyobacter sp.]
MGIYLAEFIGTMILVLLGNGVVANVVLNKSKGNGGGWIAITAGWGFGVTVSVYVTGWVSGAHINPAVTVALASIGAFDWSLVPGYIVSQVAGGFAGAVLVYLSYKQHYDETDDADGILATFSTGPAISGSKWNIVTETIGTAVLVIGVMGITNSNNNVGPMAALLVGILVWSIGLSIGGPTGYAINPARDLGPRIAHALLPVNAKRDSDWGYAWIPVVAPIFGGVIGAQMFKFCLKVWS